MRYRVRAIFRDEKKKEFHRVLTDGTVESLEPFGREVAAAMRRAVRMEGEIAWTETCYCPSPLLQEREAVYDKFFETIQTETVEVFSELKGESFWAWLEKK
jgi:hypothetical protein